MRTVIKIAGVALIALAAAACSHGTSSPSATPKATVPGELNGQRSLQAAGCCS